MWSQLNAVGIAVPAIVAGVAAGLVTDAMIKHHTLREEEARFAEPVFKDMLPPREQITLTNLSGIDNRKFTWPNVDRGILLNMGDAYDSPLSYRNGAVLIHELTHAWQIHHRTFLPGFICGALEEHLIQEPAKGKDGLYNPSPAGRPWSEYSIEQQARVVEWWFEDRDAQGMLPAQPQPMRVTSPWFPYVAEHIWTGVT